MNSVGDVFRRRVYFRLTLGTALVRVHGSAAGSYPCIPGLHKVRQGQGGESQSQCQLDGSSHPDSHRPRLLGAFFPSPVLATEFSFSSPFYLPPPHLLATPRDPLQRPSRIVFSIFSSRSRHYSFASKTNCCYHRCALRYLLLADVVVFQVPVNATLQQRETDPSCLPPV